MRKSAIPVVPGLGLLVVGAVGAHAQTYPYCYPYYSGAPAPYYNPYYAGGAPAWQICPNTVFSNGYGSPNYYPIAGSSRNPRGGPRSLPLVPSVFVRCRSEAKYLRPNS
jgi:hypothetical protein